MSDCLGLIDNRLVILCIRAITGCVPTALVDKILCELQVLFRARRLIQAHECQLHFFVPGSFVKLFFARTKGVIEEVRIFNGRIQKSPLAGCVLVGDAGLVQKTHYVRFVAGFLALESLWPSHLRHLVGGRDFAGRIQVTIGLLRPAILAMSSSQYLSSFGSGCAASV